MFVRNDQQMTARIRKSVQQSKASPRARNDVIGFIVVGLGDRREEALGQIGLRRQDILNTPRSVQRFHIERY